ncbi:MAG: phosphomannomutase [Chromatiaceae bacterium]
MQIGDLMAQSGVQFGTSGARGLAVEMTDRVCYTYTVGFLQYVAAIGALQLGGEVALAGDYRPSTGRILAACSQAVADLGYRPRHLGRIPSPAIAAFGLAQGMPSLMVTGSHIPDDRNGIKFNLPTGEIMKADEAGIRDQVVQLPSGQFAPDGAWAPGAARDLPPADAAGYQAYVARYLDFFPAGCLAGLSIGLYEHSSVARDALFEVLTGLGAQVDRLARSEVFIPVDTEAIRPEDISLGRNWAATGHYQALVSTDGDGDRPLVSDERGEWLRGDVAGILCARYLGAEGVATPVSCNTALEKSGWFGSIRRTRIGSPYVITGMAELVAEGLHTVVGYEANGGFLTATDLVRDGRRLSALPTRDAVLVAIALLLAAREQGLSLSALAASLPPRFTASDRLKDFPTELSREHLGALTTGNLQEDLKAAEALFGERFGPVATIDTTDGVRITFANGEIAHLRPSGNAPELRAYTEADSQERAWEMNRQSLELLAGWRR